MKKFDQINVIPFIDIMLVLLAIVLMTATFIAQGKIDAKTPFQHFIEVQEMLKDKKFRVAVLAVPEEK